MKLEGAAKHFFLAFLLALAGYIVIYQSIEHRRTRKGPWQVTFTTSSTGAPIIIIDQPRLAITGVKICFPGETTPVNFASPQTLRRSPLSPSDGESAGVRGPPLSVGSNAPALLSPTQSTTLVFGQPRPVPCEVPFGQCVFMDTTFLPGTVTLQLFGHEIELLPRVLVIDRQEHPWRPGTIHTLLPTRTPNSAPP